VLSYAALIVVNVLSSLNVFGPSNAEVSRMFYTPLTPSGYERPPTLVLLPCVAGLALAALTNETTSDCAWNTFACF